MLSPDLRTFLAYPRQKLFENDSNPMRDPLSIRNDDDEAVQSHRSVYGRVGSWIRNFKKSNETAKIRKMRRGGAIDDGELFKVSKLQALTPW